MPNVTTLPRTLENGRTITQFTDTTSTTAVTYTYPTQQTGIQIENSGEKDIFVTVGSYTNQLVKADTKWKVDVSFTSFSISSVVNSQEFIATAFVGIVTDMSTLATQMADIATVNNHTITYGYDTNGNVQSVTEKDANNNTIKTVTYTYNASSDVTTSITVKDGKTVTTTYNYDANSNITSTSNVIS